MDPDGAAAAEPEDDPDPVHGVIDFAAGQSMVRFLTASDFAGGCIPDIPCGLPNLTYTTLTGMGGIGYKGIAVEAGVSVGLTPNELPSYFVARVGARVESGWRSIFSVMFRFQFVYRMGDLEGMGASASVGFVIRPIQFLGLYGEAACDIFTVPPWASQVGGIFAYTPIFTGGMRFQLGH